MMTASMLASIFIAESFEEMVFIGQLFTKMTSEDEGLAAAPGVDTTGIMAAFMVVSVIMAELFEEMVFIGQCYIPHQEPQGTPQEAKYWTLSDLLTNISLFHLLYYLI